ncbi:TPA: hypothetical protein ACIU87_004929, partial [Salmonella enterica subsp. enterica serovar Bovismorbificans]
MMSNKAIQTCFQCFSVMKHSPLFWQKRVRNRTDLGFKVARTVKEDLARVPALCSGPCSIPFDLAAAA